MLTTYCTGIESIIPVCEAFRTGTSQRMSSWRYFEIMKVYDEGRVNVQVVIVCMFVVVDENHTSIHFDTSASGSNGSVNSILSRSVYIHGF